MTKGGTNDFWAGINAIGEVLNHVSQGITDFVEENREEVTGFLEYLENFEDIHSGIWKSAAENGWFPNDFITADFEGYVGEGKDSLDRYMITEIESVTENIREQLVELYPARKDIIEVAFELHNQGNYIASIPLFLAQTDGICAQSIGSYLFSERDKRISKIKDLIEEAPEKSIILAPLLQDTEFGARIANKKKVDKAKAPNRNGILHGSRGHLDYGSKVNSLKCISLLAYIATILFADK